MAGNGRKRKPIRANLIQQEAVDLATSLAIVQKFPKRRIYFGKSQVRWRAPLLKHSMS